MIIKRFKLKINSFVCIRKLFSSAKTRSSAAIDIPMSTLASHITISNSNGGIGMGNNAASNANNNNDSMASSNNSSTATSVSNNNSFSSVSLNSNFQQSAASSNTVSAATTEANINALTTTTKTVTTTTNSTNSTNSTIIQQQQQQQQDIFDVTIDSTSQAGDTTGVDDENLKAASSSPSNSNANMNANSSNSVQVVRRMRLMKRRYKSGLPLTNDRSENDPTGEEFNMRQYYDYAMNKTSKDDSGETFYHSRVLKVLMRRKSLFGVKIKQQQKMQTN